MRVFLRVAGSLGLVFLGLVLVNLAIAIGNSGQDWSEGAFNLENLEAYFIVLGSFWAAGAFTVLFGLLGLLAALRLRNNPDGGRVLTIVVSVGALLALGGAAGMIFTQGDPGSTTFLMAFGPLSAGAILTLLLTTGRATRPQPAPAAGRVQTTSENNG